jgi:nitrogen-specific signal transduction histidine kinase
MIVLWDVSQEQQALKERLKSAELEGISRTIATVNHEINNPLFGLMATVQLLRSELQPTSPTVEKKFQRIGECCERIQHIVDKLSHVIQPARRTYAANEGMLDLSRAMGQHGNESTNDSSCP